MASDGLQTHPHHSILAGDTLCHLWMLGNVSTGFTLNSGTFVYGKYFLFFKPLKSEKDLNRLHIEWHRTKFVNEPVGTRLSTIPANTTLSHNVGLMLPSIEDAGPTLNHHWWASRVCCYQMWQTWSLARRERVNKLTGEINYTSPMDEM